MVTLMVGVDMLPVARMSGGSVALVTNCWCSEPECTGGVEHEHDFVIGVFKFVCECVRGMALID